MQTLHSGGKSQHLSATCKGTLLELTTELHSMCPQVASLEISQAIQAAILQDDCLMFFGGHSFGVEVVGISELKPRATVQHSQYAYNG